MLIHVSLDAYAFVGTHMFETNPATQRMAEQTGLDSLSDPVFILDTEQQIVRVNDRAEALFSSTLSNTLPIVSILSSASSWRHFVKTERSDLRWSETGRLLCRTRA